MLCRVICTISARLIFQQIISSCSLDYLWITEFLNNVISGRSEFPLCVGLQMQIWRHCAMPEYLRFEGSVPVHWTNTCSQPTTHTCIQLLCISQPLDYQLTFGCQRANYTHGPDDLYNSIVKPSDLTWILWDQQKWSRK